MLHAEHRTFESPDEVRRFEKGRLELLECEAPQFQYHATGTIRIQMADGHEFDAGPAELTALPAGHDAWVVGTEAAVMIDWHGASTYAQGGVE